VSRAIAASRDREAGDRERARTWRGDVTIATREKRAGDPAVSQETAVPFSRFSAREKSERIHVTEELTALNARRIRVDFVSKLCTHVCVCVYRYILYIYIYIYNVYKTWAVPAQYGIQFATDSPSGNANNRYWVSLNESNRSLRKHFCAMGTA
jgi:hypothetical protein